MAELMSKEDAREHMKMNLNILALVNKDCDYIDLENCVCRFVDLGLTPRDYTDSFCPYCLSGLHYLKWEKEKREAGEYG